MNTKSLLTAVAVLALGVTLAPNVSTAEGVPTVPIVIQASDDYDACASNGVVAGLDPHGDGWLARISHTNFA